MHLTPLSGHYSQVLWAILYNDWLEVLSTLPSGPQNDLCAAADQTPPMTALLYLYSKGLHCRPSAHVLTLLERLTTPSVHVLALLQHSSACSYTSTSSSSKQPIIKSIKMPASVEYITNPADTTFDYESDPVQAVSSYARMMHEHTKAQMDTSCRALRRRASPTSSVVNAQAPLPQGGSSMSSTSSRSSF